MARSTKIKRLKRVQLRLNGESFAVCDRLSSEEISEILEVAIRNGIRPGKPLGMQVQAIIRPEALKTKTIARINTVGTAVQIVFSEKREDFRSLMHQFLYEWSGWCWARTFKVDSICDRVSEIAHTLLLNGFAVQVDHSEVKDRAVSGQYEPEAFRRVILGSSKPYEGWFVFEYPRHDDFYGKLSGLTGAKYADGRIRVPPEHFAEVEDFAEQHDFQVSPDARTALEESRSLWESALLVMPAKKKRSPKPPNPIEDYTVEIPDALKDDLV